MEFRVIIDCGHRIPPPSGRCNCELSIVELRCCQFQSFVGSLRYNASSILQSPFHWPFLHTNVLTNGSLPVPTFRKSIRAHLHRPLHTPGSPNPALPVPGNRAIAIPSDTPCLSSHSASKHLLSPFLSVPHSHSRTNPVSYGQNQIRQPFMF